MEDYNGDMLDIPVLITNIYDELGGTPNEELEDQNWILTRRFFLFDTISGIEVGEYPDGLPYIIRYPKEIILKIQLDTQELIFLPFLEITYRERSR